MQPSNPGRSTVLAACALLTALALTPVALVSLPPILDYPNHMARMHILAALPSSVALARYYAVSWAPVPNLALDATVPWLAQVMPVGEAMRLFLAFTLVGLASGCIALHRVAFGRWSLWPLTGFLLLYNRMLLWGFLNYLAGLALVLWGLAAWLALERRPMAVRLIVGTTLATAIYLAHLAAFGCYALAVMALSIIPSKVVPAGQAGVVQRSLQTLLTLVPAVVLFLLSPTSSATSTFDYGNPLRKFDLPVSIFDNYSRVFDGATFALLLIAAIVGLVRGKLDLHARLRWPLIALVIAFVVMPSRLLSAAGIDHRLPVAIAFIFIAATDWSSLAARSRTIVGSLLLGLFVVRLLIVGAVWLRADRTYTELRAGLDLIAPGDAVALAAPARSVQAGGTPLLHFATLAVVDRDAFVPTVFADRLQQPVHLTDRGAELAAEAVPAALWQKLAAGTVPPLPGYADLIIVDPPTSLRAETLPGEILFNSPRMIVVRLTRPNLEQPK